jgi:hypothetical protein
MEPNTPMEKLKIWTTNLGKSYRDRVKAFEQNPENQYPSGQDFFPELPSQQELENNLAILERQERALKNELKDSETRGALLKRDWAILQAQENRLLQEITSLSLSNPEDPHTYTQALDLQTRVNTFKKNQAALANSIQEWAAAFKTLSKDRLDKASAVNKTLTALVSVQKNQSELNNILINLGLVGIGSAAVLPRVLFPSGIVTGLAGTRFLQKRTSSPAQERYLQLYYGMGI